MISTYFSEGYLVEEVELMTSPVGSSAYEDTVYERQGVQSRYNYLRP